MDASAALVLRSPSGQFALPAPDETVLALLRRSEQVPGDWDELAKLAALDPMLTFRLLLAASLPPQASTVDLHHMLAEAMAKMGQDLLRAGCLGMLFARRSASQPSGLLRISMHGLFVAELALHLAAETRQGSFREAYAAGLLHDIGAAWLTGYAQGHGALRAALDDERALSAAEIAQYGVGHAAVGAMLAARCGLPASVCDAIHLHHCPRAAIADAAPLARVVWLAEEVAGSRFELSEHDLGPAAELSGLDMATLTGLRTEVGGRLASVTRQYGIAATAVPADAAAGSAPAAVESGPWAWSRDDAVAASAIAALARISIHDAEEAAAAQRLSVACRLLLDLESPLLMVWDAASRQLRGVPEGPRAKVDELAIEATSAGSAVAHAFREGTSAQVLSGPAGPEHSAADWQLARRLGGRGLLCEPFDDGRLRGVAVFGLDAPYEDDRIRVELRKALVAAAARRVMQQHRAGELRREAAQEVHARHREHYRRLAHEASNPLAVLKTYLAVLRQRVPAEAACDAELGVMDRELDRVAAMVRGMARPPETATPGDSEDESRVEVCGLLEDLRVLYGESLFTGQGVEFELVVAPEPRWAAMPRDALKQVLLNLLKNAAEALQAGRHFCVVVVPAVNLGGVSCVGIRLSDDGAGMPREAMSGLFAQPHSSKGGEHQGVGLVVVREILARYGASVVCESDSHTGTVFSVYIPLADQG